MDEIKAKQQVVEKIKEASKILVTVSDSPSVDALSAALGLTLLLDKQEKYATAIFSGETPPAIAFLEPQKTFDDTTDSLRDFIIALNKEKADHLRYKIEGESVKIFITPYKTTINQDDLEFSQGDYNVELVIALGVDNQDHLDKALDNHGQILHDAAIVTMTAGDQSSELGGIDWHDANASSLSEMVAGLAEALKEDKKKSLLDAPLATALLTGIVAETDRFSNEHTTSKVMTVSAALMAAGADQQLIATELQQAQKLEVRTVTDVEDTTEVEASPENSEDKDQGLITIEKDPTTLSISHEGETLAELDERIRGEEASQDKIDEEIEAAEEAAGEFAEMRAKQAIEASTPKIEAPVAEPADSLIGPAVVEDVIEANDIDEPTFGGALSATADQAQEDARRAAEEDQNRTILSHAYIGDPASTDGSNPAGTPQPAPGSTAVNDVDSPSDTLHSAYAFDETSTEPEASTPEAVAPMAHEKVIQPLSQPTESAYAPPAEPAPADLGLPLPPPIPDFSQGLADTIPPAAPPIDPFVPPAPQPAQPGILGDILAPEAPAASGLAYEATNAVPAPGSAYADDTVQAPAAPGQYQIPGQPQQ